MGLVSEILRAGPVPQLFVFDIDYTLWQAHVDCTGGRPFRKDPSSADAAFDAYGDRVQLFPEAREILDGLKEAGARCAAASRTTTPDDSRDLLATLDMLKYFENEAFMQIYPGRKTQHFAALRKASGADYEQMIFFDDEYPNVSLSERRIAPLREKGWIEVAR